MSDLPLAITPDVLRRVDLLADLADDDLAWIGAQCELRVLDVGDVLLSVGGAADVMYFVLAGRIDVVRGRDANAPVFTFAAGAVTGVLPYSRMTHWLGTGRAVLPSSIALFPRAKFRELLARVPVLQDRFVARIADRVRETTQRDDQYEKLSALGRMAAGLTHELNNPAAAIRRLAADLADTRDDAEASALALGAVLNEGEYESFRAAFRAACDALLAPGERAPLGAAQRADREDALQRWLEQRGVEQAWELAAPLVERGVDAEALERHLVDERLRHPRALELLGRRAAATSVLDGIRDAAARISALVASVKGYTHMDRGASDESLDVTHGLESTLTLLAHRFRDRKVVVERQYDSALPRVHGRPGELNQVWTNLIDNAAAVARAAVVVRARRDGAGIAVDVEDDGPGVPAELLERIWDPFFTTKPVGQGTGLGLDIARRIVQQHGGRITLDSSAAPTRFTVTLPAS